MLTRRHKIIVGVAGVIVMPAAFVAGIYIAGAWEHYKTGRAPNANGSESELRLRKEEQRLIEEREVLERRIGAMEAKVAAARGGA